MSTPQAPFGKIFPRNLTARAEFQVRGNPASTRPESGVDNCYPGLEFDQRNLDTAFFPGLAFEFHRPDGAPVRMVAATGVAAEKGLTGNDRPLYLWALCGRTMVDHSETNAPTFTCTGLAGLDVWRRVHDLLPGRIAILLGPTPGISSPGADVVGGNLNRFRVNNRSLVQRSDAGVVEAAVLVTDRSAYLDPDGVIDPTTYGPGDLTRSLCAPWQYDFRDCGCFYWAASKPDIVTSSDGQFPYLNFQRRDRTTNPPPTDLPVLAGRRETELDYAELVSGWNVLPVVINDRENDSTTPVEQIVIDELDRDQVIAELRYLATVEHALSVEYLFAHYSLNAPLRLPANPTDVTRRIATAAQEVFSVAVDEMRHLRWANEALALLGAEPSLGRADRIGRSLDQPFTLQPLTPDRLDWFIEVEKPSQVVGTGVDGMYVRLHTSIDHQPELFPERDRLVHLLKLIIDEGDDHFHRFLAVKSDLSGLSPDEYLRALAEDAGSPATQGLRDLADQNYAVLLGALHTAFGLGDQGGGVIIEQARRAMFNLHETNHLLAARGVAPRFSLPRLVTAPPRSERDRQDMLADITTSLQAALTVVADSGGRAERDLVLRQEASRVDLSAFGPDIA